MTIVRFLTLFSARKFGTVAAQSDICCFGLEINPIELRLKPIRTGWARGFYRWLLAESKNRPKGRFA